MQLIQRHEIRKVLEHKASVFSAVYVYGPACTGKTELCKGICEGFKYINLQNLSIQSALRNNPSDFANNLPELSILDGVHHEASIFPYLKKYINLLQGSSAQSHKSCFILIGSLPPSVLTDLSRFLSGSISYVVTLPFSVWENLGNASNWVDTLFNSKTVCYEGGACPPLWELVRKATFPGISGKTFDEQGEWLNQYVSDLIMRDINGITKLEKPAQIKRMVSVLARYSGLTVNHSLFAREVGLAVSTYKRYFKLLESVGLIWAVEPWLEPISVRLSKGQRFYFLDTGAQANLLGVNLPSDDHNFESLARNFLASEIYKNMANQADYELTHFRTSDGRGVDFILTRKKDGGVIAIDFKPTHQIVNQDIHGITTLSSFLQNRLVKGLVVYLGDEVLPLGKNIYAVPINALWSTSIFDV